MNVNVLDERKNNRYLTNVFLGYNHNPVINDGEMFDCTNMTSDNFPLMSPRPIRKEKPFLSTESGEDMLSPYTILKQDTNPIAGVQFARDKSENVYDDLGEHSARCGLTPTYKYFGSDGNCYATADFKWNTKMEVTPNPGLDEDSDKPQWEIPDTPTESEYTFKDIPTNFKFQFISTNLLKGAVVEITYYADGGKKYTETQTITEKMIASEDYPPGLNIYHTMIPIQAAYHLNLDYGTATVNIKNTTNFKKALDEYKEKKAAFFEISFKITTISQNITLDTLKDQIAGETTLYFAGGGAVKLINTVLYANFEIHPIENFRTVYDTGLTRSDYLYLTLDASECSKVVVMDGEEELYSTEEVEDEINVELLPKGRIYSNIKVILYNDEIDDLEKEDKVDCVIAYQNLQYKRISEYVINTTFTEYMKFAIDAATDNVDCLISFYKKADGIFVPIPIKDPDGSDRTKIFKSTDGFAANISLSAYEDTYDLENATGYKLIVETTEEVDDEVAYFPLINPETFVRNTGDYDGVRGVLQKNGHIAYMRGNYLFYDNEFIDLGGYILDDIDVNTDVTMISYNTYILIFPLNVYYDTYKKVAGSLGARYSTANQKITFTISDATGSAIGATISSKAPEAPENKDYWIDTGNTQPGLYQWSDDLKMWVAVSTSYVLITIEGMMGVDITKIFSEGDPLFLSDVPKHKDPDPNGRYSYIEELEDLMDGSLIEKISMDASKTTAYIVVPGLLKEQSITFTPESVDFERKIPKLDYVCVSNNRIWGCFYGENEIRVNSYGDRDVNIFNEIYAAKPGNFKNWYSYKGISDDSYALSIGDDSPFTGAVTYNGYPLFFKENCIYKIYGSYPAAYQLYTYDCRGCQKGSSKSIAVVGEYIFYKSERDVCLFNGESPTGISTQLGNTRYKNAVAGVSLNKYYISMEDEKGQTTLFNYDLDTGLWMKEDHLPIKEFTWNKNGLLVAHDSKKIYALTYNDDDYTASERYVEWEAVTGEYNYDYPDKTFVERLTIRAQIPIQAELEISISYDDKPYTKAKTIRGDGEVKTQSFIVPAKTCDHYRIKFKGVGDVRIYGIARTFEYGGEKNGLQS